MMKRLTDVIKTNDLKLKKAVQMVEDSLAAFSNVTKVPVTFFSVNGTALWEYNRECKCCIANEEYYDQESNCMYNLKSAMRTAYGLGEIYIYACNTGLINMCYAFVYEDKLLGYFNAGPIAMGKTRERTVTQFYEKVSLERMDVPLLMAMMTEMPVHLPQEVTYLSNLYVNALHSHLALDMEKSESAQKYMEQSQIGTKIIEMKRSRIEMKYPVEQEHRLMEAIRNGSVVDSKRLFSEYLGELMVFEGGNLSVIKLRLLTLFSKLSDQVMDFKENYNYLAMLEGINTASTFADISKSALGIIEQMTETVSRQNYSGQSEIISQAVDYIHQHYYEEINLLRIAEEIHVNNSYLSTLFKKEMGISIVDYIRDLRLQYAAELLTTTNNSITDIALTCGFREISYFTKTFKGSFGETPRQYRASHRA